jgi:hypothetical protein
MAGYLDQYGAGDERRARRLKLIILAVVGCVALSGILYSLLHNYSQERQAKRFFEHLAAGDYKAAYALWGCTDARPCSGYPMSAFMQDWGPPVQVAGFSILDGETCGNSVIVDVDAGSAGNKKIWVNRATLELAFPPYDQCPQKNRIYDFMRNIKYRLHGRTYQ